MAILDSLPWWMRPDVRVDVLQDRIAALEAQVAEKDAALTHAYAVLERDQSEHRRQMEQVRREAYPLAGPPAYPTPVAQLIASLRAALRGSQDALAAVEDRPVHGEKHTNWGAR